MSEGTLLFGSLFVGWLGILLGFTLLIVVYIAIVYGVGLVLIAPFKLYYYLRKKIKSV